MHYCLGGFLYYKSPPFANNINKVDLMLYTTKNEIDIQQLKSQLIQFKATLLNNLENQKNIEYLYVQFKTALEGPITISPAFVTVNYISKVCTKDV